MIQLREYQQDVYDKARSMFAAGNKRVLVQLPCGAGKTAVFLKMAESNLSRNPDGYVLICQHRIELGRQNEDRVRQFGLDPERVRVESIFTEARHLGEHGKPSMLILDECHLAKAASWEKVINYYDVPTIGMSATPCRLDGRSLGDVFDTMVQGVSHKWLQEHGYLAPFEYFAPTVPDLSALRKRAGDYAAEDVESLVCSGTVYGNVIDSYNRLAPGKRAIAFCASVRHSKEVAASFNAAGISAAHLDGSTPKAEREDVMNRFRSGDISILCSCQIISEGIDVAGCDCCLMLRPTMSVALWIQQTCRCLRPDKSNPSKVATILDFVGGYLTHGLPDDDRSWSLSSPVKPHKQHNDDGTFTIRQCQFCFRTFKTAPVCPYCGKEYPLSPREIKAIEDIELKQITEAAAKAEEDRKKKVKNDIRNARCYGDFLKIEKENGYKHGWAYFRAKQRGYL